MRSKIEILLKLVDEVTPRLKEIKKELLDVAKGIQQTATKGIGKNDFLKSFVSNLKTVYNEIQSELSKLRVNLLLSLDKGDALKITREIEKHIEKIKDKLEEIKNVKPQITNEEDLARLTSEERKLKNLLTALEKIKEIDAFKNFYRSNARQVIEDIRRLRAELREISASPEGVDLKPFETRIAQIKKRVSELLKEFYELPSLAQQHPLTFKAFSQLERNLHNLEAHFARVKEKVDLANNSFLQFWRDIGYLGLGFTIVFDAFYKAEEAFSNFVEKIKSAIGLFDDLNANIVKIATFYNFFGTRTAKPVDVLYSKLRGLAEEIRLLGAYSSVSLDDLLQGLDELAQHSVFLNRELIPAFANFADFVATIATTTGSSALQVRQELQALFEGSARAGNTLVRFVKRLEEIGRIPKGTLEALQNATLPLEQFRIVLASVAKEWYQAQQLMFSISGRNAFMRFENILTILIQRAYQLFNVLKTGRADLSAFAQTFNSLLAQIIDYNALQQSAEAYRRFLDTFIKAYSDAIKRGLSDKEAYETALQQARKFYEEFRRLREEAFKTPASTQFKELVFELMQLGQNLILLFANIATAITPILTRVIAVINVFINVLANSKYTAIASQIITLAIAFKLLSSTVRFLIDGLKVAVVALARFTGLASIAQMVQLRLSLSAIAMSFVAIARALTIATARIAIFVGGFLLIKSALDYVIDRLQYFKVKAVETFLAIKRKALEVEIAVKRFFGFNTAGLQQALAEINAELSRLKEKELALQKQPGKPFIEYLKQNIKGLSDFAKQVWSGVFDIDTNFKDLQLKLDNQLKSLPNPSLKIDMKLPPSDNLIQNLQSTLSKLKSVVQTTLSLNIDTTEAKASINEINALYTRLLNALKQKLESIPKNSLEYFKVYADYVSTKLDQLQFKASLIANKLESEISRLKSAVQIGQLNISFSPLLDKIASIRIPKIKERIENEFLSVIQSIEQTINKRETLIHTRLTLGLQPVGLTDLIARVKSYISQINNSSIDINVKQEAIDRLKGLLSTLTALRYSFSDLSNLSLRLNVQIAQGRLPNVGQILQALHTRLHAITINPNIRLQDKARLYEQAGKIVNSIISSLSNVKFDFSNWRTADKAVAKLHELTALLPRLREEINSLDLPPVLKEQALLRLELLKRKLIEVRNQLQQQTLGWRAFFIPFVQYASRIKQQIDITRAYATAGANAFHAFTSSLARAFQALITGQGNALRTFITSIGQAMLSIVTELIAKILVIKTLSFFAPSLLSVLGFAEGGIVNGFTPIAKFAEGGIVNRPTLGIVGEAGYPEAIIPLKSGHVPVKIVKDNPQPQPQPKINIINVVSPELVFEALNSAEGRELIVNIIRNELT